MSNAGYTRRAALAALFAAGIALPPRAARARRRRRRGRCERAGAHALVVAVARRTEGAEPLRRRWNSLPAEQQQRLLRGTRRWLAMTPEQRQKRAGSGISRWKDLSPEQKELARKRWHKYRDLPPEQQARVRENYHRFKKLTPEQRATPARALAERHAGRARSGCSSGAGSAWSARAVRRRTLTTGRSKAPASAESSWSWCRGSPS